MDATVNKFGIGQPVRRVEDQRFITGLGSYVDDIALPRQCYGVVVMSPHAHARIVSIDTAKATAAAGVLCVLTGKDAAADGIGTLMNPMPEDVGGPKGYRARRPLLAADKVRAVGDRVAFVVAETPAAGAGRGRADRGRVRDAAGGDLGRGGGEARRAGGLGRQPRQRRLRARLRQQGRDRRRLRQGRATPSRCGSKATASAPTPSSRAPRSATTTPPTMPTRSMRRRRIRTATARSSRPTC